MGSGCWILLVCIYNLPFSFCRSYMPHIRLPYTVAAVSGLFLVSCLDAWVLLWVSLCLDFPGLVSYGLFCLPLIYRQEVDATGGGLWVQILWVYCSGFLPAKLLPGPLNIYMPVVSAGF